jgi:hypothetical protein
LLSVSNLHLTINSCVQYLVSKVIVRSLVVLANGESTLATTMASVVMLLLATVVMHFGESALATTMARTALLVMRLLFAGAMAQPPHGGARPRREGLPLGLHARRRLTAVLDVLPSVDRGRAVAPGFS